jgi:glycerol-3-phosphate dehydrogenase
MLTRLAPHLVRRLDFLIPVYSNERFKNFKLKCGLWLYDMMGGSKRKTLHERISAAEVRRRCPGIRQSNLTGGLVYSDCRTDDARHTLEVLKTACSHGATILNYARVSGLVHQNMRVRAVDVVDVIAPEGSEPVRICGRVIINATGVWSQNTCEMAGASPAMAIVPAKGVHITLSPSRLPIACAMLLPSPHDERFCFAVPWYDSIVVGTTDTLYEGTLDNVCVLDDEAQYCLDAVNAMFPDLKVTLTDVTGRYAGLRPLVSKVEADGSPSRSTSALSRGHHLSQSTDGLITITGGKLTTYRLMAEETGNLVASELRKINPSRAIPASKTRQIMLSGWNYAEPDQDQLVNCNKNVARSMGLSDSQAEYLHTTYGGNLQDVLMLTHKEHSLRLPIHPAHEYIRVQVIYAIRYESAITIEDVLARRIRLTITDKRAACEAGEIVSRLMAGELGWSEENRASELLKFINSQE